LFDPQQIKSAVEYEVGRGGQILFVHSNISEMGRIVRRLKKLLPQLRIESAHGRMAPDDLERVMLRMVDGDLDMLVSTTIIEAGIDLQNVNTILINNAHRYGLAQLYQMRGRVGRSTQQAYCHLLLPGGDLSQEAHERLRTIQYNTELGSGYDVALRDLEIRGGGNLFGVEQSGHLASVGYHLFCKIVREAAQERLSGDDNLSVPSPSKVALSVDGDALIPESYVQEQDDRLYFYRMLAAAEASDDVSALEQELRDRFGPEPNEVSNLLSAKRIRLAATSLPVDSVEVSQSGATIWLSSGGNTVDSVHTMLGDSSSGGPSFTVVNKPNGKSGLTLDSSSTTEALQAIQYTFESRLSPQ
jgi:transcription-repair coupling factor (superfamily II helicase)